jgi:predicted ribosomally synthesized peptide with nif11-like leader
MSKENLAKFMQQVQLDPSLQQKLAAAPDNEQASRLAVELGAQLGLEFNEAEVLDSLNDGELDESELETVSGGRLLRKQEKQEREIGGYEYIPLEEIR